MAAPMHGRDVLEPGRRLARVAGEVRPRTALLLQEAARRRQAAEADGCTNLPTAPPSALLDEANLRRLQAAQDRVWDQHRALPAPEAEPQAAPASSAPLCKVLGVLNWDRGGEWLRLLLGTCSLDWLSHADEQGLVTQPSPHAVTLTTSACSPEAEAPKLSSVLLRRCVKGGKLLTYNPGPALQLLLHYGSAPEVQTRFTTDDRKVLSSLVSCGPCAIACLALLLCRQNSTCSEINHAMVTLLQLSGAAAWELRQLRRVDVRGSGAGKTGPVTEAQDQGLMELEDLEEGPALYTVEMRGPQGDDGVLWDGLSWKEGPLSELQTHSLVLAPTTQGASPTIHSDVIRVLARLSFLCTGTWPSRMATSELTARREHYALSDLCSALQTIARFTTGPAYRPTGASLCPFGGAGIARCFDSARGVDTLLQARHLRVTCTQAMYPAGEPRPPASWFLDKARTLIAFDATSTHGLRLNDPISAVLRADSDRLQPSNQRDVVLVHYSASRMHTIALLLCIRGILAYGRGVTNREREFALHLCELLLDNETLRPFTRNLRRELWVTRITQHRRLNRSKRDKEEVLGLLRRALNPDRTSAWKSEEMHGSDRQAMLTLQIRLAKECGDTTPLKADKDPPPLPCIVIHTTLEPKHLRKGRRIFEGHKNVEEVALSHFRSMGYDGHHTERRVYLFFYNLLFFDIIRDADIPGVYTCAFTSMPLDSGHASTFYELRRHQLDDRLRFLNELCEDCEERRCMRCHKGSEPCAKTHLFHEVARLWSLYRPVLGNSHRRYCNWLTKRQACEIAAALGRALIFILATLLKDSNAFQKGLPDLLLWGRVDKITSSLDPSPIVTSSDDTTFGEAMKAAENEGEEEAMEVEEEEEEAEEREHDYVATPMEGIEEEGEEEGGEEEAGQAIVAMPTGRLMLAFGWSQAGLEDEDDGEDEGIAGEEEQQEEEEWMRVLCCVRLRGRLIEVKSVHDKISVGQLLWHGMLHRESRGRWGIEECRVLYHCDCRNCERKRG